MINTMLLLTEQLFGDIFVRWINCEPIKYIMCFVMFAFVIKIVKSLMH